MDNYKELLPRTRRNVGEAMRLYNSQANNEGLNSSSETPFPPLVCYQPKTREREKGELIKSKANKPTTPYLNPSYDAPKKEKCRRLHEIP